MKMIKLFSLLAAANLALAGVASAASAKTYQVTGPVVEVNDSMIVVEKGAKKERWEVDRNSDTKVDGDVKVGDKVTITYTMTAKHVEMKAGKGGKGGKHDEMKAAASASPTATP